MKRAKKIGLVLLGLLAASQLVRYERTNPPVTRDVAAPAPVAAVLRRACYDCHSNETVWPWYSRVAPVSWLVHSDVTDGRHHLNFSEWDRIPEELRTAKLREVGREVEGGDMPPSIYLPMHSAAHLSDGDKQLLKSWYGAP